MGIDSQKVGSFIQELRKRKNLTQNQLGERLNISYMDYEKKISLKDIKVGIDNLSQIGDLIGRDNTVYQGLVEGINQRMNIDVEECFNDSFRREALVAEIIVQSLSKGAYIDISEVKSLIKHEHWLNMQTDMGLNRIPLA